MKKLLCLLVVVFGMCAVVFADITMTFEEFLGSDGAPISTYYSGISFTAASSGQQWIAADITTGGYNASSWPSGSGGGAYWIYGNVAAWAGVAGDNGKIEFDNKDAKFVEIGYSAQSTLYLEAFDAMGNSIDVDNGPGNLRSYGNESGPGTLRVDWNGTDMIAWVIIHDQGNFWVADNVRTDATGISGVVPAPGAIVLGAMGASLVGWLRRRRSL